MVRKFIASKYNFLIFLEDSPALYKLEQKQKKMIQRKKNIKTWKSQQWDQLIVPERFELNFVSTYLLLTLKLSFDLFLQYLICSLVTFPIVIPLSLKNNNYCFVSSNSLIFFDVPHRLCIFIGSSAQYHSLRSMLLFSLPPLAVRKI